MIRPLLRVARPDDWTGMGVRVGAGLVTLILLLAAVLGTLPRGWVQLVGGNAWLVRAVLIAFVLWFMGWARAVSYALLPKSPVLLGKRLLMPVRGRRVRVRVTRIAALHVERRPEPKREVFVVEFKDGAEHDLCPVHWEGAERLFRALQRKIR